MWIRYYGKVKFLAVFTEEQCDLSFSSNRYSVVIWWDFANNYEMLGWWHSNHNRYSMMHVSQDLTFLYSVGPLYWSSGPMWWGPPHPNVCGKCPLGTCHPWLQSRVLCLWMVTSLWLCTCIIQCSPPYERGCSGPVRQSVSGSQVDHTTRFLAVTFPGLHRMCRPHQTNHYTVVWVHLFSNVCLYYHMHWCPP